MSSPVKRSPAVHYSNHGNDFSGKEVELLSENEKGSEKQWDSKIEERERERSKERQR